MTFEHSLKQKKNVNNFKTYKKFSNIESFSYKTVQVNQT